MNNIYLTGLMGCGKSAIARALSDLTGRNAIDVDETIERESGMKIPEIFERFGEGRFRDIESDTIKRISKMDGLIVATGGGAVLRSENIGAMIASGRIVFIDRPIDSILQDLDTIGRPLLNSGRQRLIEIADERRERYESCADFIFRNEYSDAQTAAKELLDSLAGWF